MFFRYIIKRDTTRMVGRTVTCTPMHTSLLNTPEQPRYTTCISLIPHIEFLPSHYPVTYTKTQYIVLIPDIYLHRLHFINPPQYTYTTYISLISHIDLHSLHLINPPPYSYTAYISLIPHISPSQGKDPGNEVDSLHLINPLHIPAQPTSH